MTSTALRFTKTHAGRYAATEDGFRYLVRKNGLGLWELTIAPTMDFHGVEIVDPNGRENWYEFDTLADAKAISQAFAELADRSRADRFREAISLGFDRLMGRA